MAWTTPRTWADGYVVTGSDLNEQLRDNMNVVNTAASAAQSSANAAQVTADQGHRILTTAQKNALTGVAAGTMVYDSDLKVLQIWNGVEWNAASSAPMVPATVGLNGGAASANTQTLVTFSGVTSVELNNCFTAAFEKYEILIRVTSGGATQVYTSLRRLSTTNLGTYNTQRIRGVGTTLTTDQTSSYASSIPLTSGQTGLLRTVVYSPLASTNHYYEYSGLSASTWTWESGFGRTPSALPCDGFQIAGFGGAISGDVRVVGIAP